MGPITPSIRVRQRCTMTLGKSLWEGLKKDITEFVAKCSNCQKVKVENQRPGGMTQNIEIPLWKW